MKLNKIFGLLAVALCATAQLDAGAGRRAAARGNSSTSTRKATTSAQPSAPAETSIPVTTPVAAQAPVAVDTTLQALVDQIINNCNAAAEADASGQVAQALQNALIRVGLISGSAAPSATLGRLGNSEYDKCCETCAKKHKKTNKKGHAHTKKSKSNKKEHAKKK
ncbi:hypothetical protein EBR77_04140 [bacterium]|nr:hypothetical protein [bacterium]NBX78591.1 hypothetical protein [bacterium]